jgi:hypothetical protein
MAADATHQPLVPSPVREPIIRTTLPHAAQKILAGHRRRTLAQHGIYLPIMYRWRFVRYHGH